MRTLVVTGLVILALGCSSRSATEERMFAWANALKIHLTTDYQGNYTVPDRLEDLDPMLTMGLDPHDAWGTPFAYRTLQDDRYQLISAGPNAELGDDDDVIVENGILKNAATVYASRPWEDS